MKKIFNWIAKAWTNTINWVKPKASTAVAIVNALKNAVESQVVISFVSNSKNKYDDAILATLRQYLPAVSEKMLIVEKVISSGKSSNEILQALVEYLQDKHPEARIKFYAELAARLTQALADNKITFAEALSISQFVYAEFK